MSRPPIEIDEKHLIRMARLQMTYKEMASELECCDDTLSSRYSDLIKREREKGKSELRAYQWYLMKYHKSIEMAKWLGREYLGQGKADISAIDITPIHELAHSLNSLKKKENPARFSSDVKIIGESQD